MQAEDNFILPTTQQLCTMGTRLARAAVPEHLPAYARLGRGWWRRIKKRLGLTVRQTLPMGAKRIQDTADVEGLKLWQEKWAAVLAMVANTTTGATFGQSPHRIFNLDETGICIAFKTKKGALLTA